MSVLRAANQLSGEGTLYFPTIGRFEGRWDRGKVIKVLALTDAALDLSNSIVIAPCLQWPQGKYVFEDGLVYDERKWEYCPERDRRFRKQLPCEHWCGL